MIEKSKPKLAATVILLRAMKPSGFEVFLTRRPEGMAFLGGMYCFPGGTVRKEDSSPGMLNRCYGMLPDQARKVAGGHFTPQKALGFWIAGIREVFEETGILLAVNKNGERIALGATIATKRAALLAQSLSFQALLESEDLFCDLSTLAYFSRWQTPSEQSLRFVTRFFLTALPDEQSPLSSSPEVVHSLWVAPDYALTLHAKKGLPMIFPTFAALRTLADFDSLESLFRGFQPTAPNG